MLLEDLFQAYFDARANKRNTHAQLKFELHLEEGVMSLYKEIVEGRYRPGKSVCFIINDPVKREVFAASFRDRIVHHLIYNAIYSVLEKGFIYDSYSCRVGKGTLFGIRRLEHHIRSCSENYSRDSYVLKLDISGYFMNIDRGVLYDILMSRLSGYSYPNKQIIDELIRKIVFYSPSSNCLMKGNLLDWDGLPSNKSLFNSPSGCGLPIGNLTSQLFSNVYLSVLDDFIKRELHAKHYGRYVDDFFIIDTSRERLSSFVPRIENFLESHLHLHLHPRKTYLQNIKYGVPFLGAVVKPYRRYPVRRTVSAFKRCLSSLEIEAAATYLDSESILNSYLGYFQYFSAYRIVQTTIERHNAWLYASGYFSGRYAVYKAYGGSPAVKNVSHGNVNS